MTKTSFVIRASYLIALLSAIFSTMGLLLPLDGHTMMAVTPQREEITLYGKGLYRNDSAFKAGILRGTDAVTLFVGVPALLAVTRQVSRGGIRAKLALLGLLAYFTYNSASLALGAYWNEMLLMYIICFSLSLFSFISLFQSIEISSLAYQIRPAMPYRVLAGFCAFSGLSLLVWLADIFTALTQGKPPAHLDHYHTEITYVLDLAILLPAIYLASFQLWNRNVQGVRLAAILLILLVFTGLVVAGQSIVQALDGIIHSPQEYAAYVAPFIFLSLIATGLTFAIFRNIAKT
ncbi:hypothetical protein BECAL_02864 [Bellilinea caldifistulae]|uniref:Uncharacterized protein n=1 Tax=Bellilinea caldifistulae TaxID=360411 RepID=A0A0P6WW31_9CHLR|nr:hypothetical protein [Bellilinea caldifistulae]KPL74477.1 hypothetical protein AC812_11745 [Bellilinea caldifistulae]GAP11674.1 hypothetical protein BECAL_02864 [Bellilinea caldifistulae]